MSPKQLKASRALWMGRERAAKRAHTRAVARDDKAAIKKHGDQLRKARSLIARRDAQLNVLAPRIITSASLGLKFQYVWGTKGPL
jgi:hypothetical protein